MKDIKLNDSEYLPEKIDVRRFDMYENEAKRAKELHKRKVPSKMKKQSTLTHREKLKREVEATILDILSDIIIQAAGQPQKDVSVLVEILEQIKSNADRYYCRAVDECLSNPLLKGAEAKIKDGTFTQQALDTHRIISKQFGKYEGLVEALRFLNKAIKAFGEVV